jgi:hypothetical protein
VVLYYFIWYVSCTVFVSTSLVICVYGEGFVTCGCVYAWVYIWILWRVGGYVWVLYSVGVCMCGFCNVWVSPPNTYTRLSPPNHCYMPRQSHYSQSYHLHKNWWGLQIMELLMIMISPFGTRISLQFKQLHLHTSILLLCKQIISQNFTVIIILL